MRRLSTFAAALLAAVSALGAPVEFEFEPPPVPGVRNPFARELTAEVLTPSGRKLLLPAYYTDRRTFAVRARPDETGPYRLGSIVETTQGRSPEAVTVRPVSLTEIVVLHRARLPAVGLDARRPGGFARADGRAFIPFGANLAWAPEPGDPVPYYRAACGDFAAANLNWMRVWMAHWGRLNLDWLPPDAGPSPAPGGIDHVVAERWDRVLAAAEEQGVYVQLVLQHHGQFSTTVNPNWAENPWNAANPGGFLKTPAEFFTDPNARVATLLKYRYIVARYGWSPAIFAWELFNEVHWVDALKLAHDEAAVARWHQEMAGYLRSVDAYGHLVTTSTEDLGGPVVARMDFLQPHLYAPNLLTGVRRFAPRVPGDARPVFYGEFGVDHLRSGPGVGESGLVEPPVLWAAVVGGAKLPPQAWEGAKLRARGRLGELGAVHRFFVGSGLARQHGLVPFAARVESARRVPLSLVAGQQWQRRAAPALDLPLDGREPGGLADWPSVFALPAKTAVDAFPSRASFRADFPADTTLRLHVAEVAPGGGALRVLVDGVVAKEATWSFNQPMPAELAVAVRTGAREVRIENAGTADWVRVPEIGLGVEVPVLTALGSRNASYLAVWVSHRANLFAPDPAAPDTGTLLLDDVAAGTWRATWWDTVTGKAGRTSELSHAGGELRLPIPPVLRHAAVVLERRP